MFPQMIDCIMIAYLRFFELDPRFSFLIIKVLKIGIRNVWSRRNLFHSNQYGKVFFLIVRFSFSFFLSLLVRYEYFDSASNYQLFMLPVVGDVTSKL